MGRAMLIICAGVLVGLGYTYFGMNSTGYSMTEENVNFYKDVKAKNMAHLGVQVAVNEHKNRSVDEEIENEFQNLTKTVEDTELKLTLEETTKVIEGTSTDIIIITSKSNYQGTTHEVIATFDISQHQQLVPIFNSALDIATDSFDFSQQGSSSISGIASQCIADVPGISVINSSSKEQVTANGHVSGGSGQDEEDEGEDDEEEEEDDEQSSNYGADKGISGEPPVAINDSLNFDRAGKLIKLLEEKKENIQYLTGNYKGSLGTPKDPGVFIVNDYAKLSGGIDNGYGIIVIKKGAVLDLKGNIEFNGLVISEDGLILDGAGTPVINGSSIVGSPENSSTTVDVTGNIHLQYDCNAKKYAELAVNNRLNTTLYQQLSIYE